MSRKWTERWAYDCSSEKTNKSVRLVRTILEILALVVGWLLGGSVGIGTLVSALGLGYVLQIVFRIFKFDTKLLKHRFIIDDIREWKEKKNEEHKCKSSIVIKMSRINYVKIYL